MALRHGDVGNAVRLELVHLEVERGMDLDSDLVVEEVVAQLDEENEKSDRASGSVRDRFWKRQCLAFGSREMQRSLLAVVEVVVGIAEIDLDVRVGLGVLDARAPWPLPKERLCRHHALLEGHYLDHRHGCAELGQMDE